MLFRSGNPVNGDGCNVDCQPSSTVLGTKTYDQEGGNDVLYAVATDDAGNAFVAGRIVVGGNTIWMFVRKYDADLNVVWTRTLDESAGNDYLFGATVDASGNLIVTGRTSPPGQGGNVWTRKYTNDGAIVWTRTYDLPPNDAVDQGLAVAADANDSIVVTGESWSPASGANVWIRKYDSAGTTLWTKVYNGPDDSDDIGRGVAFDPAGDVVMTGESWSTGHGKNIFTRKFDGTNGETMWTKVYAAVGASNDVGRAVAINDEGDVYIAGEIWVDGQGTDVFVRKMSGATGDPIATKTYNNAGVDGNDSGRGIAIDSQGAVVVTGTSWNTGEGADVWTRKYDSALNVMWTRVWQGTAQANDNSHGVAIGNGDDIYIAGEYRSSIFGDLFIRRYSP